MCPTSIHGAHNTHTHTHARCVTAAPYVRTAASLRAALSSAVVAAASAASVCTARTRHMTLISNDDTAALNHLCGHVPLTQGGGRPVRAISHAARVPGHMRGAERGRRRTSECPFASALYRVSASCPPQQQRSKRLSMPTGTMHGASREQNKQRHVQSAGVGKFLLARCCVRICTLCACRACDLTCTMCTSWDL